MVIRNGAVPDGVYYYDTESQELVNIGQKPMMSAIADAFPEKEIAALAGRAKAIMVAEMNAGQMVRDVRAAVEGRTPVHFYGRMGGMVPSPQEIEDQVKLHLKKINLI